MEINVRKTGNVVVVTPVGDVNAHSAPELDAKLDELIGQGEQNYVLDLGDVPFMDSSGLGIMVKIFKRIRIGDGDVKLASPTPAIMNILRLTRLERVFDIYEEQEAAVTSFGQD